MRYKIKEFAEKGIDIDGALPAEAIVEALADSQGDPAKSNARFVGHGYVVGEDVFVNGKLTGHLELPCSRCLQPADIEVDVPVKMTFVPQTTEINESDNVLDDNEVSHHDGDTLDLDPMLRELLILAVPLTNYCKDDCRGLCAECGENLNVKDCGHRPSSRLSPFAQLANLSAPKA
jgi:uncharacterized protein